MIDIKMDNINKSQRIFSGGGSYDEEGNQKKIGKWVNLEEGFKQHKQVIQNGEYNMNGIKVGRWDIMYCKYEEKEYKQIGGGSYDQEGNQKKIGKWVDLDEGFKQNKQVTYNGEYNIQGQKVDRWDIMYLKYEEKEYKQIGGGSYDQEGNQKKIGIWVDLDEGFQQDKQVTYNGEYNLQGLKVGRWDIMHFKLEEKGYKQMGIFSGGGSYDQEGNQRKIGKWVELDVDFKGDWFFPKQVTHNGQYNQKGQKVGTWIEMNIMNNQKQGEKKYDN
ncbi:unnamed protein product [Paramecium sonneborni]|uniref:Uncharacterized protein n=1 Tax=Paramecium sonneborni TaxID=65129 RepID=A0A8S1PPS8_9CILI|nr:unnamed protein product [Paramecium sonneborni]